MANIGTTDSNALINFALHWLFAGFWAALGFALFTKFVLPHIPGF